MGKPEFVKVEKICIKDSSDFSEKWVQDQIAEDPTILGLGDVVLKDKERPQPKAGRLDLLLQDLEANRRYEVEVQLGKSDESHIIRTIEYWDIERKRYPQYDHCAVIVAEDITSRFLNVIGLFNGHIPLIAIQMNALRFEDKITLMFTTVLDELPLGLLEEDEEEQIPADRAYWENKGSKATVKLADSLLELIKTFDPGVELKYNKYYIGLARDGHPDNYALFRATKSNLRIELKLKQSEETREMIEGAGLDLMEYSKRNGRYRIRVKEKDIKENRDLLTTLLKMSREGTS